jgi:hypothetical protein
MVLDNKLDGDTYPVGGGGNRSAINRGPAYSVTGNILAIFEDMTLYNKAINGTESSLDLSWKWGTGAGSAGNESVQLVVPELTFSVTQPPVAGPKGVLLGLGFTGCFEDNADATALKMVIKNALLPGYMV